MNKTIRAGPYSSFNSNTTTDNSKSSVTTVNKFNNNVNTNRPICAPPGRTTIAVTPNVNPLFSGSAANKQGALIQPPPSKRTNPTHGALIQPPPGKILSQSQLQAQQVQVNKIPLQGQQLQGQLILPPHHNNINLNFNKVNLSGQASCTGLLITAPPAAKKNSSLYSQSLNTQVGALIQPPPGRNTNNNISQQQAGQIIYSPRDHHQQTNNNIGQVIKPPPRSATQRSSIQTIKSKDGTVKVSPSQTQSSATKLFSSGVQSGSNSANTTIGSPALSSMKLFSSGNKPSGQGTMSTTVSSGPSTIRKVPGVIKSFDKTHSEIGPDNNGKYKIVNGAVVKVDNKFPNRINSNINVVKVIKPLTVPARTTQISSGRSPHGKVLPIPQSHSGTVGTESMSQKVTTSTKSLFSRTTTGNSNTSNISNTSNASSNNPIPLNHGDTKWIKEWVPYSKWSQHVLCERFVMLKTPCDEQWDGCLKERTNEQTKEKFDAKFPMGEFLNSFNVQSEESLKIGMVMNLCATDKYYKWNPQLYKEQGYGDFQDVGYEQIMIVGRQVPKIYIIDKVLNKMHQYLMSEGFDENDKDDGASGNTVTKDQKTQCPKKDSSQQNLDLSELIDDCIDVTDADDGSGNQYTVNEDKLDQLSEEINQDLDFGSPSPFNHDGNDNDIIREEETTVTVAKSGTLAKAAAITTSTTKSNLNHGNSLFSSNTVTNLNSAKFSVNTNNSVNSTNSDTKSKRLLAVHCTHGVNRTGFFVIAYLLRYKFFDTLEEAKSAFE